MNFNVFSSRSSYCYIFVFIILLCASVYFIIPYYFDNKNTAKKSDSVFVVGMLGADAPFMSINENGEYEGFDVDIAMSIANMLGKKLEIREMGVAELFIALEHNQIEMMMCGLAITKSRLEKFGMVHYQGDTVSHYPLIFWNTIPDSITTIEDFNGKNAIIATLPATTMEEFLLKFPFITVRSINSYADIIMELQFGKITAAFFDEAISSYMQRFPEIKVLQIPLGDFTVYGNGIAINKNNTDLIKNITNIVDILKQNGTIKSLEQKWHMTLN